MRYKLHVGGLLILQMMGNPDMLRQMMDNPMVQSLMSNPDVMRQMITSNPQMRELMEVKYQSIYSHDCQR